jgi:hypothetical protein
MDSIRSSSNPYSQHPPLNRARYPLDYPRIAHTASGAFLWVLIPYDGQRAYRAFWCEVALMSAMAARDVNEICFGNMGRILGKWRDLHGESFPLSRRESQTRTRGWATTTISSVDPATQHGSTTRLRTQSRGTPIDAGDFHGTGVNITNLVTACNNRMGRGGSVFSGRKKRGSD